MKTEHLLIMRFTALGEVAMLVPVVSSLAQQYPELRITVLSQPFARPLFGGIYSGCIYGGLCRRDTKAICPNLSCICVYIRTCSPYAYSSALCDNTTQKRETAILVCA